MAETVYGVTELVGTSSESWEKAARAVVEAAASTLRVARLVEQDIHIEPDRSLTYRVKLELSFKDERADVASNGRGDMADFNLVDAALEE